MKIKEQISVFMRMARLMFDFSRAYISCIVLRAAVEALLPYVPVYFSALLIDGLVAGSGGKQLLCYAGLAVGSVFGLKMIQTCAQAMERQKCEELERSDRWRFSQKTMEMAYESIEDREVFALR